MAEVLGDNERRDLYRKMLNDAVTSESTRKYSFKDFEKKLLGDPELIGKVAGLSLKRGWAIDENDFAERFVPELKAPPTPKPKPVPAPVQQFPVGIAAPESIKGAAPSVTDIGREMAFEPAVQQPIEPVEPVEPIGVMAPEAAQKPMPSVTEVGREMAFKPPVEPKMPKEEKERGWGEWGGDIAGSIIEGGKRFTKNLLGGIGYLAQTQAAADPMLNLPYEKRQQMMQEAGQTMYNVAEKAQKDFQAEVAKRNIQTDVLQAIENKQYKKIPEATLYTIGDVAMQIIPTLLTAGGSSFIQTLPTAYKDGVEAIAKEKGISPEQVIASGDDAIITATITSGIVGVLDKFGADRIGGYISNKAGYKAVRDWLLKQNINKTLAKGAQLLGVGIGESGTEYLQEGTGQAGAIAAKSPTLRAFFEKLPDELFTAQAERKRRGAAVGGLIGGTGVAGAGRALTSALSSQKAPGLDKFSDNVVNSEIIQEAARGYGDNITKAEQQGKKPDSFNQKQLKKIAENPEAWVRDEIKYIQQTIESNKTLGLDSKVEENSLAKATSLLNQIKAEKKSMEEAALAPAQEAVPVAPEAEVVTPVEPIAPEAAPVAEEVPFEEVPAETEDELAFLDEMRLTPEEEAALLAQEGIIPAAPVAPAEEEVVTEEVPAEPVAPEAVDIESRRQEAERKIKRKDLFSDGGVFANTLGGSGVDSVPTQHREINGIEFVEFSNPNTGVVDVVMTGTSDRDFVGFYRLYENGKPTNKWSSKFENQSRNKENFKTMLSGVQEMLPEGHEYTEKTSISTDGLRVWNQQLSKGYELQYDENGNLVTNRVAINGDALVNELGIPVEAGDFNNIRVSNKKDFETVKKSLLPYLEKFGLGEKNMYMTNGTVEIDLPVLRKTTPQATPEVVSAAPVEEVAPEAPAALPKELLGKITISSTGFGGDREHTTGKVSLEDLKVLDVGIETARQTLETDKSFKPSKEPIVVGIDVNTGEKQLLDGYHRYLIKNGKGEVPAKFIPMRNGEIISFEEAKAPAAPAPKGRKKKAPVTPAPAAPETKTEVEYTQEEDDKLKAIGIEANFKYGNYIKNIPSGRKDKFANDIYKYEATNPFTGEKVIFNKKSDAADYVIEQITVGGTKKGREGIFRRIQELNRPEPAPVTPAPAAPKKEEGKKAEAKEEEVTTPEFTSSQSSEAATAFDKAKTSKGFDKKYGKGAYKALSDITKNFEDIMDKVSDKIKQDCL